MATLGSKGKLAVMNWEGQEGHPSAWTSRDPIVARMNENYVKQVSEEIKGRVIEIPRVEPT